MYRWKVKDEENTKLSFWRKRDKRSSDKFALDELITVFLAVRIGWRIIKRAKIYAPINVIIGGRGVRARGGNLMLPETIPFVGLLIVWSDPGVGTFDFDRQKPDINSEAVTKSVPRGFLKVTLLEKGVKFSFVLIAIIRYFKLSSKQIMSILRKFYLQVPIWL